MPFRARMKRAFTRSSSSSSSGSNSLSKTESRGIGDPKIYQPGEPMPRPKYRAPVDKKHKAMLESFSFNNDARRKSTSSEGSGYSPMGSRIPSRHNSVHPPSGLWTPSPFGQVVESADDDGDVANVGFTSRMLSKHAHGAAHDETDDSTVKSDSDSAELVSSTAHDHTPFTEVEINNALTRNLPGSQRATVS